MTMRWPASSRSISSGRSTARSRAIRLDRPERKNPLTFESYAELRDTFRELVYADDVEAVVFLPNGGNFCSGGDVHDIIGPLVDMDMKGLLAFTRMTGDLVKAMLNCGKPIIAAVDGVAVGAGAIIAMASDIRLATPEAKTAFLFTRVGLAGCDMGACAILPRIIGQGRAAELLYTGRTMTRRGRRALGLLQPAGRCRRAGGRRAGAGRAASSPGPTFAHGMTKTQLNQEWSMGARPGDRGRGAGAGDLHADARLRARLRAVRRQAEAGVRRDVSDAGTDRAHRHLHPRQSAAGGAVAGFLLLAGFDYPEHLNVARRADRPHGREGLRRQHRADRQRPAAHLQGAGRLDQPAGARAGRGLRRQARQPRADPLRQQPGHGRLLAGGHQGRRRRRQHHADAARRRARARSSTRPRSRSRSATRG